jgi:hypothetical protein
MNSKILSERFNLEEKQLIQHLKVLKNSALVNKQSFGKNKIFFTITERGITVLQMFKPALEGSYEIQMNKKKAIQIPLFKTNHL